MTDLNSLASALAERLMNEVSDGDSLANVHRKCEAVIREAIEKTLERADEMRNELNCSCLNCVLKALHKELKPAKVTNP